MLSYAQTSAPLVSNLYNGFAAAVQTASAPVLGYAYDPRRKVVFWYDDLFCGLQDAGIADKLDWLFAPGLAPIESMALVDLMVGQNGVNAPMSWSKLGTTPPTFTAFQGVQGDGSTGYLELGVHANAGLFAQNSASYGYVLRTSRTSANSKRALGWAAAQTTIVNDASDGSSLFSARLNDGGSGASYPASASTIGFFAASRQSSTAYNLYIGRSADTAPAQYPQTVTSTNLPVAQNWQLLGNNSVGSESAQLSFAFAGSGMSQVEINTLFTLAKTALQASGAWV